MLDKLIQSLVDSRNEAADDVLMESLRCGSEQEQSVLLGALLRRKTMHGMTALIGAYDELPALIQSQLLRNIKTLYPALRECSRSGNLPLRRTAIRLVALGRQGKLAYLLTENLTHADAAVASSAAYSLVALAKWVAVVTRKLQDSNLSVRGRDPSISPDLVVLYEDLIEQRADIEAAVARATEFHQVKAAPEILRAAMLLGDWSQSRTLAIVQTSRHAAQSALVRRLQQVPESEHVEAFLLGASQSQLRAGFSATFSRIEQAPVLAALLRKTHWLKDARLQLCMHMVTQGHWWDIDTLAEDVIKRDPLDAARIGEWLAVSGVHDVVQDQRLNVLREHARESFAARVRLLRIAARRRRGASVHLLQKFLNDTDERLVRMAAREIVRRRPPDLENILLQVMTGANESVRRIIGRAIGQYGFEQFWDRYERLDRVTRCQAGQAMLKILPGAIQRLGHRLSNGSAEQRLKAMQITQELSLAEQLRDSLVDLVGHSNPKVRSRAVAVLGGVPAVRAEVLLDRAINDIDPRVRANAIEALETKPHTYLVPLLTIRARSASNRERANAIKALHSMRVGTASGQLINMLRDSRSEHRISALWALRQIGWWELLNEVARLVREDENLRVRRYAYTILKSVAETFQNEKGQSPERAAG